MPTPTALGQPRLVQRLQAWTQPEGSATAQASHDVVEGLSGWLSAADSVALEGALQAIERYAAQAEAHAPAAAAGLDASSLSRLQDLVAQRLAALQALIDGPVARPLPLRLRSEADAAGAPPSHPGDEQRYTPWHQHHLTLQKQMEQQVAQLRNEVRLTLARGTPRLRQLVALDAALEPLLATRCHQLLAAVPVLLERRFGHWRSMAASPTAPEHAEAQEPIPLPTWLAHFEADQRELLREELLLRLKPVAGLLDAARASLSPSPTSAP